MGNCASCTSYKGFKLQVKTSIWTKNQHNLFDFECPKTTRKNMEMDHNGKLVQINQEIFPLTLQQQVKDQFELFRIKFDQDYAILQKSPHSEEQQDMQSSSTYQKNDQIKENQQDPSKKDSKKENLKQSLLKEKNKEIDNQIWYVVREKQEEGGCIQDKKCNLQIGDVIKLGRAILTVKDFVIKTEGESEQLNNTDQGDEEQSFTDGERPCCRICLSEGSTLENPLLSPCECSGSMKYLHLKCIQRWVEKQFKIKDSKDKPIKIYFWKKLKCELCKKDYRTEIRFQNLTYNIIHIPKPKTSYIMLQLKSSEKKQEKGIYVIDISKTNKIKIGRTNECDIKLNDISVSRVHSTIVITENKQLCIEDNGSKFGTLIMLQDDLKIIPKERKRHQVQCGRTLVTIECQRKKASNYHKQNEYNKYVPNNIEVFKMSKEDIEKENDMIHQMKLKKNYHRQNNDQSEDKNEIIKYNENMKGVYMGSNGKQCVQLQDIIIYDIDDKHLNNNNIFSTNKNIQTQQNLIAQANQQQPTNNQLQSVIQKNTQQNEQIQSDQILIENLN